MDPKLIEWLASVKDDPYAFALGAFPWGEPGTALADHVLDPWQIWVLCAIRDGILTVDEAIQIAVCSGHGIGKSALVSMIILWAFTTFPDCRGVVTANTETQLKTKTWAALGKWFNLCWFMKDHFTLTATALLSKDPIPRTHLAHRPSPLVREEPPSIRRPPQQRHATPSHLRRSLRYPRRDLGNRRGCPHRRQDPDHLARLWQPHPLHRPLP